MASGLIFGARKAGAVIFNTVKVEDIVMHDGVVSGVVAKKTPAAKTAPKSVKTAAAKPVRTGAAKAAKAGAAKAAKAAKAGAPAPAKKPVKKVVEKHGTRVPGKSKNQVRR